MGLYDRDYMKDRSSSGGDSPGTGSSDSRRRLWVGLGLVLVSALLITLMVTK